MTRLSVVVTIVDGGAALDRCLSALATQDLTEPIEVLVPVDDSINGLGPLRARFPKVRWVALGPVPTERPPATPAGQHELFDRRRAVGLREARGPLVGILEDRGVPAGDWARRALELHATRPEEVIGGAVANGVDRVLNWAAYICDFGRYHPGLAAGSRPFVTDTNVVYKREALARTESLWRDRYHETTVHWALMREGGTLRFEPSLRTVQHRDGLTLGGLLRERLAWGRLFAYTRAREIGTRRRLALAALASALPLLLGVRHLRRHLADPTTRGAALRATPAMLLLLVAWALGESLGYLTGRP